MKFSLVKISALKESDGDYRYQSMIMEKGASTPWTNVFESEYEMVSTMNAILARQKRDRETRYSISTNPTGEHYFFDIELTEEQAKFLGWQQNYEVETLVGAK